MRFFTGPDSCVLEMLRERSYNNDIEVQFTHKNWFSIMQPLTTSANFETSLPHTNINKMIRLLYKCNIYTRPLVINTYVPTVNKKERRAKLTSTLNRLLRQNAMAPIRHAPYDLDIHRAMRRAPVDRLVLVFRKLVAPRRIVESLPEPPAHAVQFLALWVAWWV
jgi:hypothetical protein